MINIAQAKVVSAARQRDLRACWGLSRSDLGVECCMPTGFFGAGSSQCLQPEQISGKTDGSSPVDSRQFLQEF